MQRSQGNALIVLMILALIGISVLECCWYVLRVLEITTLEIHHGEASVDVEGALLRSLLAHDHKGRGKIDVSRELVLLYGVEEEVLDTSAVSSLCPHTLDTARPIIDFSAIFQGSSDCQIANSLPLRSGPFGTLLSPSAVQSRRTCREPALQPGGVSVRGNLVSQTLSIPRDTSVTTVAALGFIDIQRIMTESDLLLVAGGDIGVQSLEALANTHPSVTIASASGTVSVSNVSGSIFARALSCRGTFVPPSALNAARNKLFPPLKTRSILGLIPAE